MPTGRGGLIMPRKAYIKNKKRANVGHYCKSCGKKHEWPPYVFGHVASEINHTCDCGQKATISDADNIIFE